MRIRFAQASICALFLLIVVPTIAAAANKFGAPVPPSLFYAIVAGLLAASAALNVGWPPSFHGARLYFAAFAVLATIGAAMYRGEGVGPDFGVPVLHVFVPSNAGYVVWPAINLVASAALFLFARDPRFRSTIVAAALGALVLQLSTMEADMWWPALFGDSNGRAGGLAQNANVAALLVVTLTALTLPARAGDKVSPGSFYAMLATIPGVLLSQSRVGIAAAGACLLCFIVAAWTGKPRWPARAPAFAAVLLGGFCGTLWLSPVLNPSTVQIEHRNEARSGAAEASKKAGNLPPAALDAPLTLKERLESRGSVDQSADLRRRALTFYLTIVRDHPLGYGTGFTNKFQTGPHNAFLKLAVDEGLPAAACLLVMLIAATWRGLAMRSPALLAVCAAAWIGSVFYHTIIVEPFIAVALAIALGMIETAGDARTGTAAASQAPP